MKRSLRVVSATFLAVVVSIAVAWVAFPQRTAVILIHLNNKVAGLTAKTLTSRIGEVHYLEGGEGDTVVLLHGVFARKEHWVDLAKQLVADYHVIALDLPGFGDNPALADEAYLLDRQRDNLEIVFEELGLEQVHVAASSMGAYVSVLLAEQKPELFASLAFIGSPLGVPTPIQSDMDKALELGQIPLLVRNNADFHERNDWLSPQLPYLPGPILKTWMHNEVAMAQKNARIWDVVHNQSNVPTVLALAPDLAMETFVLWCAADRIFHVSGADALAASLQNSTMVILNGCGHLPMLDRTDVVAKEYLDFLGMQSSIALSE